MESKEYLAGFWIMEAPDLDVVLRLAAEGSKACNRKIEVRPFLWASRHGEFGWSSQHRLITRRLTVARRGPRLASSSRVFCGVGR